MAAANKVETIYDFQELDDKLRAKVLSGLSKKQMAEVAHVCNRYPDVELRFEKFQFICLF